MLKTAKQAIRGAIRRAGYEIVSARGPHPAVEFRVPERSIDQLVPGASKIPVQLFGSQVRTHPWQMPVDELAVLAVICRDLAPRTVFEIGTFTGGSTLAMAANTPDETRILTLDLDPRTTMTAEQRAGSPDYSAGSLFAGTRYQKRIRQLIGDSQTFDFRAYYDTAELVFIDAVHTYDHVARDTTNALRILQSGGTIVWHDYRWNDDAPECAGVTECVNELADSGVECFQIIGTRFAISSRICDPRSAEADWNRHLGRVTGNRIAA